MSSLTCGSLRTGCLRIGAGRGWRHRVGGDAGDEVAVLLWQGATRPDAVRPRPRAVPCLVARQIPQERPHTLTHPAHFHSHLSRRLRSSCGGPFPDQAVDDTRQVLRLLPVMVTFVMYWSAPPPPPSARLDRPLPERPPPLASGP